MTKALILSGGTVYADPWHPFAETSDRLAGILRGVGIDTEIRDDVEDALADLSGVDLIVPNAAAGPDSEKRAGAREGLLAYLARGGGVLAVHVGAAGLAGIPEWEAVTGMAWVDDRSSHSPVGWASVSVHPDRHPIAAPLKDFELRDECYRDLRLSGESAPFVTHRHAGTVHPLVWVRPHGTARIVVDTLGHDGTSYDSREHRLLIERAALWATGQSPDLAG